MKRKIRSVILAGIMVLSMLLSITQPVRAEISPTVFRVPSYSGHITLEILYLMDNGGARMTITWKTQGTLAIAYPGDSSFALIHLGNYSIIYTESENGKTTSMVGSAISNPRLVSTSFNSQGPSFTIPFDILNVSLKEAICPFEIGCVADLWNNIRITVLEWSQKPKKMKLSVYFNTDNKIGGDCSLPGWDEQTTGDIKYTENCTWIAYYRPWSGKSGNGSKPEWTTKK